MKPDGSLTDLEMWSYWRDDKGYEYALEYQYPKIAQEDFIIKNCLMQIKTARQMIDDRMSQLASEENERNGWED